AHRVSYELAHGAIENDLHVLHKCDNPRCVNPAHLFLGSELDNARDRTQKGRSFHPVGEVHPMCKYSDEQIAEIRERYAQGGVTYAQLADAYNSTKAYIGSIVRREVRS